MRNGSDRSALSSCGTQLKRKCICLTKSSFTPPHCLSMQLQFPLRTSSNFHSGCTSVRSAAQRRRDWPMVPFVLNIISFYAIISFQWLWKESNSIREFHLKTKGKTKWEAALVDYPDALERFAYAVKSDDTTFNPF